MSNIHQWIEKLEGQRSLSQEQFYARLKHAKHTIEQRLEMADSDGIDLDQIEEYEDDEY